MSRGRSATPAERAGLRPRLAAVLARLRGSPQRRLTIAVVTLCSMMLVLGDLLFGLFPDPEAQRTAQRQVQAQGLAAQMAPWIQRDDGAAMDRVAAQALLRDPTLRRIGLRTTEGGWLLQRSAGEAWAEPSTDAPTASVAMQLGGREWGQLVAVWMDDPRPAWQRALQQPLLQALAGLALAGGLAVRLYLRRALQHMDPAGVVPQRVQHAFDAMREGVAVLDPAGRVLLTNRAFGQLHPQARGITAGKALSDLPWLAQALPDRAADHPWARAIAGDASALAALSLTLRGADGRSQHLVLNCAPIADARGRIRGCMVTFDDETALQRSHARLKQALDELSASQARIEQQNADLLRLATRDPLSGCLNRRAFNEAVAEQVAQARADDQPLAALMLDIDHFKHINDRFGHAIGDRAIESLATLVMREVRPQDIVCRYGGEEFVVTLPGLGIEAAAAEGERLRALIAREAAAAVRDAQGHAVEGLAITSSVGVAELGADLPDVHALVDRADQALYQAKRTGRNRVCRADRLVALEAATPTPPANPVSPSSNVGPADAAQAPLLE